MKKKKEKWHSSEEKQVWHGNDNIALSHRGVLCTSAAPLSCERQPLYRLHTCDCSWLHDTRETAPHNALKRTQLRKMSPPPKPSETPFKQKGLGPSPLERCS